MNEDYNCWDEPQIYSAMNQFFAKFSETLLHKFLMKTGKMSDNQSRDIVFKTLKDCFKIFKSNPVKKKFFQKIKKIKKKY